jgi:ABC-type nitrate/sulfonate/bicarbonate transport system permease component
MPNNYYLHDDKFSSRLIISTISICILFVLWMGVVCFVDVGKGSVFPSPVDVLTRLIQLLRNGLLYDHTIWHHLFNSLMRWGIGFGIAVFLGIPTGVMLGVSRILNRVCMPIIYMIQIIPGLAWIPIALLLFGIGNVSTIFMIFILGYTPIVISTAGGIQSVSSNYINSARILGANRMTIVYRVLFPFALLSIINGLRIGLANAWRVLIAAEMIVGAGIGLGYIIIQSRWSLDFEAAFVSIFLIVVIGLIIEKTVFGVLEKRFYNKLGLETSHRTYS